MINCCNHLGHHTYCNYILLLSFLLFFFSSGYPEIVKFLLARGADVNAVSDLRTALTDAAIRGFPSVVKTLLEHNADELFKLFVDILSFNSNSPL